MDYEKKLREALDSEETDYEVVRWIESTFPELAESEDERIRKALIELVGLVPDYMFGEIKPNKFIAYLEKQKALSKLGKYIAAKRTEPGFMFDGNDSVSWEELPLDVRKHDYPYHFIGDLDCYPFVVEKQKEQPKEELVYRLNGFMQEYIKEGKDEAEKEHRFKCYHLFWDALEDENFFEQKEQKPDDDPLDDPKFLKGFDTGREVQRIFDEQKPAEWDIMDIQHVNTICDCLDLVSKEFPDSPAFKKAYDGEKAWLQGLPHRVNLQPVEWSEVDDEELSRIAIERSYDAYPLSKSNTYNNEWNAKRVGYNQGYEQAIRDFGFRKIAEEWPNDCIKPIRPSWKPSEEQMEVLQTAERLVRANNYPENAKILAELYERLKAL